MDSILFLFVVAAAAVTVQGHLRKTTDLILQIRLGLVAKMWFPTSVSNADDISEELLTHYYTDPLTYYAPSIYMNFPLI